MERIVRTALVGLGNVGRHVLTIFATKEAQLTRSHGLRFVVTAVADSSGVAMAPRGFDPVALRDHKVGGGRVADLDGYQPGMTSAEIAERSACDLLLEASPVNLESGEPGLGVVRQSLSRGIPTVLANKAPLVLAYRELHQLAERHKAGLAFSATVCGGLPVINIGQRDLIAAEITRVRGIFNSTTNFMLDAMTEGSTYAAALAEARRRGIAEADPSLDVEGWDTANKLVIIANSVLGMEATLDQVSVTGIMEIEPAALVRARQNQQRIKLVAEAVALQDGAQQASYRLSVKPQILEQSDFLASCRSWEMGIEITSDLFEVISCKIWEEGPMATAAAMVRDSVNLLAER